MDPNEKEILLHKFLTGRLSEADKSAFEGLVRTDVEFAGEVAMRLTEMDAFDRTRETEKADIQRRFRQRRRLRRALWDMLLIVVCILALLNWAPEIFVGGGEAGKNPADSLVTQVGGGSLADRTETSAGSPISNATPPTTAAGDTGKAVAAPPVRPVCLYPSALLDSIPTKSQAGPSTKDLYDRAEVAFREKNFPEALDLMTRFLDERHTRLASFPRACLLAGALHVCLPDGNPQKAVLYLGIAHADVNQRSPVTATLLLYAYACTGDCSEAGDLIKNGRIIRLPDDDTLQKWLSDCKIR